MTLVIIAKVLGGCSGADVITAWCRHPHDDPLWAHVGGPRHRLQVWQVALLPFPGRPWCQDHRFALLGCICASSNRESPKCPVKPVGIPRSALTPVCHPSHCPHSLSLISGTAKPHTRTVA